MEPEVIDAVWEEPRVVASISNVSTSGVGLILEDELPTGLQFDVNWEEGESPGPVRFEVVHTKPLSAGLYRTGARLVAGELPVEPVPTPFVRRFELAGEAEEKRFARTMAMVPINPVVEVQPEPQPHYAPLSLVRDGVMSLSRVPAGPSKVDRRTDPAGDVQRLARRRVRQDRAPGRRHRLRVGAQHRDAPRGGADVDLRPLAPARRTAGALFVDAEQFEGAVDRLQAAAGSPFVATTLAA